VNDKQLACITSNEITKQIWLQGAWCKAIFGLR
jgi:hypothetical protein